jgi:Leucine-rich repeat (LRR) protein
MGCGSSNENSGDSVPSASTGAYKNLAEFLRTNPTEIDFSPSSREENEWMKMEKEAKMTMDDIPDAVWSCTNCKKLVISCHGLTHFPEQIFQMTQLEELEISDGELTEVPAAISQLKELRVLSIYRNKIVDVDDAIGELVNLSEINLFNNMIKKVPLVFNNLVNLQSLNLGDNKFLVLPDLSNCVNMENLQIHWGKVAMIKGTFETMTKLTDFMANRNRLATLPELPPSIQNLDINNNQSNFQMPESFSRCVNLVSLEVVGCGMPSLPNAIFTENLEGLKCEKNKLTSLPDEIANAKNLTAIFFKENQLTKLPEGMKQLSQLKRVDVRANPIDFSDATTSEVYESLKAIIEKNDGKIFE